MKKLFLLPILLLLVSCNEKEDFKNKVKLDFNVSKHTLDNYKEEGFNPGEDTLILKRLWEKEDEIISLINTDFEKSKSKFDSVNKIMHSIKMNHIRAMVNKMNQESVTQSRSDLNACDIVFDFIKKDLNFPLEAKHHRLDCKSEFNKEKNVYIVYTFVTASNAYNVRQKLIYKYQLRYTGNEPYDMNSWEVVSVRNEIVK